MLCHLNTLEMQFSFFFFFFLSFFFFFYLFRATPWHMEIPRLGVNLELQLPAYTTATATQVLSHICELHHSLWQRWILNPLSGARNRTHIFMDTSGIHFH